MDLATHGIHELADNPEANAETTVLAPGHRAFEGTKDAGLVLFRDADAVIPNSQPRGDAVSQRSAGSGPPC
jgi:hypothetical protein